MAVRLQMQVLYELLMELRCNEEHYKTMRLLPYMVHPVCWAVWLGMPNMASAASANRQPGGEPDSSLALLHVPERWDQP